jgi:hypothetical protein
MGGGGSTPETWNFAIKAQLDKLATEPSYRRRTRHIDVHHHYVREQAEQNVIRLEYVQSKDNLADALTKPLPKPALTTFVNCKLEGECKYTVMVTHDGLLTYEVDSYIGCCLPVRRSHRLLSYPLLLSSKT